MTALVDPLWVVEHLDADRAIQRIENFVWILELSTDFGHVLLWLDLLFFLRFLWFLGLYLLGNILFGSILDGNILDGNILTLLLVRNIIQRHPLLISKKHLAKVSQLILSVKEHFIFSDL